MSSIPALFLSLTGLLLLGCLSSGGAEPLPLRTVAKGAFSGIQLPKQELIKDQAAWDKIWAAHATSGKAQEQVPKIDFSKEMVIVATLGKQRSGGYSIEITEVQPLADRLQIAVSRKKPSPDAMTIQALTSPFHIVAVGKSPLKPEFIEAKPR